VDPAVRLGVILRALRYVSPVPWGSPRAEAGRRASALKQIMDRIWSSASSPSYKTIRKSFTVGGGVLWSPVTVTRGGELKNREPREGSASGERAAWLLTRLPPQRNSIASSTGPEILKDLDITESLWPYLRDHRALAEEKPAHPSETEPIEVLYDCRFLIRIIPSLLPEALLDSVRSGTEAHATASILVTPHSQYHLPRIVWRRRSHNSLGALPLSHEDDEIELARLLPSGTTAHGVLPPWVSSGSNKIGDACIQGVESNRNKTLTFSDSIKITWIRSLEADGSEPERGNMTITRVKIQRTARSR
jgi:hypothetical protein